MRLMALDQIHVSSVQADVLRPRQEFTVSEELGDELLAKHPATFQRLPDPDPLAIEKAEEDPANKAAPPVKKKPAAAPKTKAARTKANP